MSPNDPRPAGAPGVVSAGWLAADATLDRRDQRRLGPAMWASVGSHAAVAIVLALAVMYRPVSQAAPAPVSDYQVVYIHQPGTGGGGGGSPAPAPPRPRELEVPRPQAAPPPFVAPAETVALQEPPKVPQLTAPIYTNDATAIASSGDSLISLALPGGGGRGPGLGGGDGPGAGDGRNGGVGGGPFALGTPGVSDPELVQNSMPRYTSEAMRAKIQGSVELEAVVRPDGTVGDVRVVRSLDARHGLDQEAIKAAGHWVFKPGLKDGKPVAVLVRLVLTFRLY
jgi:protein TonB